MTEELSKGMETKVRSACDVIKQLIGDLETMKEVFGLSSPDLRAQFVQWKQTGSMLLGQYVSNDERRAFMKMFQKEFSSFEEEFKAYAEHLESVRIRVCAAPQEFFTE